MKISKIKQNTIAIKDGQWIDKIDPLPGVSLKVRGLSANGYTETLQKLQRDVPKDKRGEDGEIHFDEMRRCLGVALAEKILLDWKGIEDDDDKPIPYDKAMALEWLTNLDYSHFADGVTQAAMKVDKRYIGKQEDVEKNSERPSKKA